MPSRKKDISGMRFGSLKASKCVECCKICNRAKDVLSKREFLKWVNQVCIHNNL